MDEKAGEKVARHMLLLFTNTGRLRRQWDRERAWEWQECVYLEPMVWVTSHRATVESLRTHVLTAPYDAPSLFCH